MVTIIFKATEACNARCAYCDVVHKPSSVVRRMSTGTLELFFVRVNEFLREHPNETLEVIWHGGEPLLLGHDFFALALLLQRKYCADTSARISHGIQTNLTLFSRKFSSVFRELGIQSVGTSYDPIQGIRGLGKNCDCEAYNRRFMQGVALLEEEGFGWGVIYVVSKLSLDKPLELFNFFTNLRPEGGVSFNPVLLYGDQAEHLRISPREFVDFLGAIFPVWWNHRARYPHVEPFNSLTRNVLYKESALSCCDSGECTYTHINLAADGQVSQCGRAFDWGLLDYGSLEEKSISQILDDPQRKALLHRNEVLFEGECKGCRFWPICHGGCPLDAWPETQSFMHKSAWCYVKKGFIEKYFEPVVRSEIASDSVAKAKTEERQGPVALVAKDVSSQSIRFRETTAGLCGDSTPWINPIGGLGDTLMISGVLKQAIEKNPSHRFNLVARTKYAPILRGHPAISLIGHPPPGARFIGTNYWDEEDYGARRAYQILARMFGLDVPVKEILFVPWAIEDSQALLDAIPWKTHNVLVCPTTDSPRKEMSTEKWELLAKKLSGDDITIVQVGKSSDRYIRGCYNLLGLTSAKEVIALIRHFDVVVSSDSFLMHVAHLCCVPAVVLWGPTDHRIYGYSEQVHLKATSTCAQVKGCIGPGNGSLYSTKCHKGTDHCMNLINLDDIYNAVRHELESGGHHHINQHPA